MAEKKVVDLYWEGDTMVHIYEDGTSMRFEGAYLMSHKVEYPEGSGVVVEDVDLAALTLP